MKDAEVGELWAVNRLPTAKPTELESAQRDAIVELIKKIVKERYFTKLAGYKSRHQGDPEVQLRCLRASLNNFGIDPASWKE